MPSTTRRVALAQDTGAWDSAPSSGNRSPSSKRKSSARLAVAPSSAQTSLTNASNSGTARKLRVIEHGAFVQRLAVFRFGDREHAADAAREDDVQIPREGAEEVVHRLAQRDDGASMTACRVGVRIVLGAVRMQRLVGVADFTGA